MAQSLPWSVKGIDANTRDAAREAARRAGMSVSDWLEHVIREETRKAQPANARPSAAMADGRPDGDIGTRLRRLSRSGSELALERGLDRSTERDAGFGRQAAEPYGELDALLDHAAKLEARTRDQEVKTTSALESIVGWIEKAEGRMAAAERAAAERQERATSVIADAIKTVSSRVTDVERRSTTPSAVSMAHAPQAAPSRPSFAGSRRPMLSRDSLAHAISDIQGRQRELQGHQHELHAPQHEPNEPANRPTPGAIMQNLRDDLGRIAGVQHGERRTGERRADVTPLMNGLRADLAQLRQDISSMSVQPASARLEDSIRDLAQRLENRAPAALDELARPLARIEAELTRLQAQDPGHRFSKIENEIQRLGDRIELLANNTHEPRLLAAAIHELTGLKDALQRSNQTPKLDDLSTQIATLAHDMGRVREEISRASPVNDVENAIEDMREALMRETRDANGIGHGLLTRIAQQLETVSSAVNQASYSAVSQSGASESDRQQFALLSHKLDQLAQRTQPESDALARRIEDLAIKLDDMADRNSPELVARVERLSEQIDMLASRGPAALEKQIDALAARIETLANAQNSVVAPVGVTKVDLTPIEDMIGDLARRLEEVSRPEPNPTGLQALEKQIAALTERLDRKPAAAKSDTLDATLQDLMRSLGGLRDETASAVDRAARAAVADAMTRAPASSDGPALSSIRDDLAGLKDVHVSIDKRTNSAIGAVNDTLEKIVQRLAQLEDDISRERSHELPVISARGMPSQAEYVRETVPRGAPESAAGSHDRQFESARQPAEPVVEPVQTGGSRELVASVQRAVRQPVLSQPVAAASTPEQQTQADPLPDLPLEPGSGRPRGRGDATPASAQGAPAAALNPNLIAAARRAAMAASVEAEALKSDERKAGKGPKLPKLALPASLKETLEKRRKPILLGLAAIILAMGASQIATTMLADAPKIDVARTEPAKAEEPTQAPSANTPGNSSAASSRSETGAPAVAQPALPKDQTSLIAPGGNAAPVLPGSGGVADTTGSVRPPAGEIAALSPANAAPDPTRFTAAPGTVTNLGDLPSALGSAGLRRAAQEGNANAVYELGVRATDGVGMARDHKLALRLFERAAAAGSAPAQFRLGNMHEKGIGTARDAKMAITWYRRAADKGNAKAMHNLAVLIAEGAEGKPDYSEAAGLFRKAAEFGVRDSQFNLAILLGRGLGVEQDLLQSYTWFAVAARQGDADAGSKRDEVGVKLSAADLAAARNASLAWKPKTPDPISNEVAAPAEGWDPAPRQPQPRTPPKQRAT